MTRAGAVGLLALLAVGAAGCERKKAPAGIGKYHVKNLTLEKVRGRCDPTDLPDGRKGMWCYAFPSEHVAGMKAEVNLYFGSNDPKGTPIEIQLQVSGCKEGPLAGWIRSNFGAPFEERSTKAFWENANVYVVGELPAEPGRCLVRVLPKSEKAELERLRAPS
ncbi:MAG TPA: hypothetical protein VM261_23900 [Kofleriaceae bacterium]|nr:hypothetical protein [Kofleriaceae bacterium]